MGIPSATSIFTPTVFFWSYGDSFMFKNFTGSLNSNFVGKASHHYHPFGNIQGNCVKNSFTILSQYFLGIASAVLEWIPSVIICVLSIQLFWKFRNFQSELLKEFSNKFIWKGIHKRIAISIRIIIGTFTKNLKEFSKNCLGNSYCNFQGSFKRSFRRIFQRYCGWRELPEEFLRENRKIFQWICSRNLNINFRKHSKISERFPEEYAEWIMEILLKVSLQEIKIPEKHLKGLLKNSSKKLLKALTKVFPTVGK